MLAAGAWAERSVLGPYRWVEIPDGVAEAQAATLLVAGLTALQALRNGGLLLGKKVLIGGASGGASRLAVQISKIAQQLVDPKYLGQAVLRGWLALEGRYRPCQTGRISLDFGHC